MQWLQPVSMCCCSTCASMPSSLCTVLCSLSNMLFPLLQLDTGDPALDADHSRASSSVNIPIVITPCPGSSTTTRLQPIAPSQATIHQPPDSEARETGPHSEVPPARASITEPSNQQQSGANGHGTGKRKTPVVDSSTVGPAMSDSVRRPPKQAAPPCYRPGSVDAASMNTVMR